METQSAPQIHVGREEIRVLIIHLQLSPSPQPGYDRPPEEKEQQARTPNPYLARIYNKRNIHHF